MRTTPVLLIALCTLSLGAQPVTSPRDEVVAARMRGLKPIARKDTLDVTRFELHGSIALMGGYVKLSPAAAR